MTGDSQQDLLQAALSGQAASPDPGDLTDLLAERFDLSPRARAVLEVMMRRQQAPEPELDDSLDEPAPQRAGRSYRPSKAERIREAIADLKAELQAVRSLNGSLARALGACPLCWGEDQRCQDCQGRGSPGNPESPFDVDTRLYARLVEPAVRRMEGRQRSTVSGGAKGRTDA